MRQPVARAEADDAGVFEEPADNGFDADVFAEALDAGSEAADAAADTMTKRFIAAPSESLNGTVRTNRRIGVARSARASEGALGSHF